MSTNTTSRKLFSAARKTPGPGPGWYARAARELGYSPGYISRIVNKKATSAAARAAVDQWKKKNRIA